MKFCIQCGKKILPEARFCAECGAALPAPTPMEARTAMPAPPPIASPQPSSIRIQPSPPAPEYFSSAPQSSMFDPVVGEPGWVGGAPPAAAPYTSPQWGQQTTAMAAEPHVAPASTYPPRYTSPASPPAGTADGAIWNPKVSAAWGIAFSPIFSAWVSAKNWRTLGDGERAKKSMLWVYGFPLFVIAWIIFSYAAESFLSDSALNVAGKVVGYGYLAAWFYFDGQVQLNYVKDRLPTDYPKKSWLIPLSIAVGIFVALIVLGLLAMR